MQDIYTEESYLTNNPTWHEENSPWKAKNIIRIIKRNNLKPFTICEVRCDAGEILKQLSGNLGIEIQFSGYEISSQAFELCQETQTKNLVFYLNDLTQENGLYFDIVMAVRIFGGYSLMVLCK